MKSGAPGTALLFLRVFISPSTHRSLRKFLSTVIADFFLLQFSVKFGFRKIPVINIDHPLDEKVPFTPEKVSVYLDFISFWIRPSQYIIRKYGWKTGRAVMNEFLGLIRDCYLAAAEAYRFRMTTTSRPKYYKGSFLTIHLFDPHYLCVPSLHVIIVVLAYTFYRRIFEHLGMEETERKRLNEELFSGAVEITETVLLIKQHSVNCIPAALYTIGCVTPNDVYPLECVRFIECLFRNDGIVKKADAASIRLHIEEMYERLLLEGCHDGEWVTPLHRWLSSAEKANGNR